MKRIALVAALLGACMFILAGVATAGKVGLAKTWVYDPGNTGAASATWTKDGLLLKKDASTETVLSAGAEFKGVEGQPLTHLGFDVKAEGQYCGGGSPRFNVETDEGVSFFGCSYGDQRDLGNGWTHVTFSSDVIGAAGAFGHPISTVEVMRDEEGQSLLRNITVNDIVVDKFPHS